MPDTKDAGSDDEENGNSHTRNRQPSLTAAISATLTNPKRLIGQKEMVHAILLGIQGTNKKVRLQNNKNDDKIDLSKLPSDELLKICKEYLKIECPSCGSDNTEPHKFSNFEFEIYAPKIFESLRVHLEFKIKIVMNIYVNYVEYQHIKKKKKETNRNKRK